MRLWTWPLQAPHVLPQPFLAAGQGCGAERPHGLTPPPPSAPRASERSGRIAGRGAEQSLATPPGLAFSRAAASHWALAAPARLLGCAQLQPNSSPTPARLRPDSGPTPARLQPDSSPTPALLRLCSSPDPALLQPGSLSPPPRLSVSSAPRLPAPNFRSLCRSASRTPVTSRPPKTLCPIFYPPQPRHSPPPFLSRSPSVRTSVGLSVRLPTLLFLPLSRVSGLFASSTWRSSFAGKSQKPLQKAYNEI